jgi:hypothetical protein
VIGSKDCKKEMECGQCGSDSRSIMSPMKSLKQMHFWVSDYSKPAININILPTIHDTACHSIIFLFHPYVFSQEQEVQRTISDAYAPSNTTTTLAININ